jgi:hypothetical protein
MEHVRPDHLGASQHLRDELHLGVVVIDRRRLRRGRVLRGRDTAAAQHTQDLQRVDSEEPTGDQGDDNGPQADAVHGPETAAAGTAHVLDVAALVLIVHVHGGSPRVFLPALDPRIVSAVYWLRCFKRGASSSGSAVSAAACGALKRSL